MGVIHFLCDAPRYNAPKGFKYHSNSADYSADYLRLKKGYFGTFAERGGFRGYYSGKNTYFGITKEIEIPGKN